MTYLDKLIDNYCESPDLIAPLDSNDLKQAFRAGFKAAQEMTLAVWEHENHTHCDFFYDGKRLIKSCGNANWDSSND